MNFSFKPLTAGLLAIASLLATACQKQTAEPETAVPTHVLAQVKALGFGTHDISRTVGGYRVEGDILLTDADLAAPAATPALRIAEVEQYRTNNLVQRLPRTITVSMDVANFPAAYQRGLDEAIRRYNAQNLDLKFQRVSSGGMIRVLKWSEGGAIAGFPSNGNPFPTIRVNPATFGNPNSVNYAATIIAHELGHCVGFRHTDYMDRRYSCGPGEPSPNEGPGTNGAIRIPGTPSGPEAKSWMLACQDGGDRPFTNNDVVALRFLYRFSPRL